MGTLVRSQSEESVFTKLTQLDVYNGTADGSFGGLTTQPTPGMYIFHRKYKITTKFIFII